MPDVGRALRTHPWLFAASLSLALLIANIAVEPNFAKPGNWPLQLATLAPLALAAMASTPSIVSGGGGLDISVSPIMVLVNVVFIKWLVGHDVIGDWYVALPLLLAIGAAVGAGNGLMVTFGRIPPVIATLCTLFVIGGLAVKIAGDPLPAPANWTSDLADQVWFIPGALILMAIPVVIWNVLARTPFHRTLYAVGGNDATSYSAGVDVYRTRLIAYALNGLFAAVGGIALTALVQSTQATATAQYLLVALTAVALGGTPLYGGRGGLACSFFGAFVLYLVQTLLSAAQISSTWLNLVYGVMLVVGVVVGARLTFQRRGLVAA